MSSGNCGTGVFARSWGAGGGFRVRREWPAGLEPACHPGRLRRGGGREFAGARWWRVVVHALSAWAWRHSEPRWGHPGIGMHGLVAFEGLNGSADGDCAAGWPFTGGVRV